ncbi:hypothetical protein HYT45_02600 [Candidatus Uhrbacteria bacterium]|nr:hypothetical protein [Candidatus Uhrbacteria bacterium]
MPRKKTIKNIAEEKPKKLKKKSPASNRQKKKVKAEARFQELRDAVERLPEISLPGAPQELPADLPDANPSREPSLIPEQKFFADFGGGDRVKVDFSSSGGSGRKKEQSAKVSVWAAVLLTFAVIFGVWFTTLKDAFEAGSGKSGGPKLTDELTELKNEWEEAAENIKAVLAEVNTRLQTVSATGTSKEEELLRAMQARVIFEASRATSTE